ncbi:MULTISPECIES: Tol-Pal system beta propeller repeat protein TolB [Methylococcus]|uniref:Tol-Pal system protein TolB n=1 Tax=Methylococcus capsulatus TaxID=414 RepID=A0ABZ2F490_METCP|nr:MULTISPECIES: Tol-Pal system beta propeller repeat protein TolB [Methylococcus]MDF9393813.1 Tol-Pal system beta propeller repeat protein TolB [Methylococcus capsulatus]
MNKARAIARWISFLLLFAAGQVCAELQVQISQGVEGAIPVAVVPFANQGSLSESLSQIVSADLQRSGRFRTLAESAMRERPTAPDQIQQAVWQSLGQDFVVVGQVQPAGGDYEADFHVVDVIRGTLVISYKLPFGRAGTRQAAHRIADVIYKAITGEPGAFATRVAYVTVTGEGGNRRYNLQVADTDGYNPQSVIVSNEPIMSPAWSPDGTKIAYVSFESRRSAIYVQTLATGERRKVSDTPGINGAPAFSPDGSRLALTLSKDGNPDIYVMNLGSGGLTKITDYSGIDTEPNWSRDGRSIVFTSDRGGKPQLYLVSAGGGPAERLTYEGDYNARGVFSPDGRSLAMVHGKGGDYRIAVMDLASRAVRVLTNGPLDESPGFAPNGSMILYAARRGQLAAVSIDGKVRQSLQIEGGAVREPAWSP